MRALLATAIVVLLCGSAGAQQGVVVPPAPAPDLSGFATTDQLNAISNAQSLAGAKQPALPTTPPGAGKCQQYTVSSDLVTSGGMPGTAGTCSRILLCGTSTTPVVTQFNVGSGC